MKRLDGSGSLRAPSPRTLSPRTLRARASLTIALLALAALLAPACQQLSPEEEVERLRSQFTVQASPFSIRETPLETELEPAEEAADEDGDGIDSVDLEPPPVKQDVLIDVLVGTESSDALPGLTLDVDHVDSSRELKERYLYWIDTSSVTKGSNIQVTIVIEDVDYEEGDAFSVSVRTPVPAEERSEYREFP